MAIINFVGIHRFVLVQKNGFHYSCEVRNWGECKALAGNIFRREWYNITSCIIEAIGVLGSVSSIFAFVLYLCDKYGRKK